MAHPQIVISFTSSSPLPFQTELPTAISSSLTARRHRRPRPGDCNKFTHFLFATMALLAYGKSNQNHADGGGNKPLLAEKRTSPTDQYNFSSSSVTASTKKNGNVLSGNKPLPLKQRTSSSSNQRDFNQKTWLSLLVLVKFREFFVTVDHFSIWRRHLAWANDDGKDLRTYMTQRYASNMVFMSLLLSTELGEYG